MRDTLCFTVNIDLALGAFGAPPGITLAFGRFSWNAFSRKATIKSARFFAIWPNQFSDLAPAISDRLFVLGKFAAIPAVRGKQLCIFAHTLDLAISLNLTERNALAGISKADTTSILVTSTRVTTPGTPSTAVWRYQRLVLADTLFSPIVDSINRQAGSIFPTDFFGDGTDFLFTVRVAKPWVVADASRYSTVYSIKTFCLLSTSVHLLAEASTTNTSPMGPAFYRCAWIAVWKRLPAVLASASGQPSPCRAHGFTIHWLAPFVNIAFAQLLPCDTIVDTFPIFTAM